MAFLLGIPIRIYRWVISPVLHALSGGTGCGCRFHPSCSAYALEALETHGAWQGMFLAFRRILKCHPWHDGGIDLVPTADAETLKC